MSATISISDDVANVLAESSFEDGVLKLPPRQLERDLYVRVNKILEALGGKWNRGKKGHVFKDDPRADVNLAAALGLKMVVDKKKTYGAFYTPSAIAGQLVDIASINRTCRVLEPSAGEGAIVEEILKTTKEVAVCEIRRELHPKLSDLGAFIVGDDFLDYRLRPFYDAVIANPPFSGGQDVLHVDHMLDFLVSEGVLVSIMAAGMKFRKDSRFMRLRDRLDDIADWELIDLPEGSFEESGTGVNACILRAEIL